MNKLYVIGDVHGDYDRLHLLLNKHNLISFDSKWIGDDSTLVLIGDLTDRGDKGIEVIELVMSLEKQAQAKGGNVVSLCGNHDAIFIAQASQFRGDLADRYCYELFEYNGGFFKEAKFVSENEEMFTWMQKRPLIFKFEENLFQHADSCVFYNSMGNTIDEINEKGFELMLSGAGAFDIFYRMTDCRYWDAVSEQLKTYRIDEYMEKHNVKRIFHGHTRFIGDEPQIYYDGKIINVDGSLSNGYRKTHNRGFVVEVHNAFTS